MFVEYCVLLYRMSALDFTPVNLIIFYLCSGFTHTGVTWIRRDNVRRTAQNWFTFRSCRYIKNSITDVYSLLLPRPVSGGYFPGMEPSSNMQNVRRLPFAVFFLWLFSNLHGVIKRAADGKRKINKLFEHYEVLQVNRLSCRWCRSFLFTRL